MSVLGIIALIFGASGVWLTIKQIVWCWPISLVAVVASISEFYSEKLFGDMALQIFYFFAGVYGWIYWQKNKTIAFTISRVPLNCVFRLVLITLAQSVVYYYLLSYFNGDRPLFDGLLTACSLTATYMMTKKWLENWATWVLIDGAYVILYGIKHMWLFAVLYLLFAIMAFYGWVKWKKAV